MDSTNKIFKSLLKDGLKRVSLQISVPAQTYIENLLIFYIHSDHLFDMDEKSGRRNLKTLSEFYFKLQEASFNEKLHLLKQIGDRSLYLGGFFRESLKRKLINLNYYLDMGQTAYGSLAQYHKQDEMFLELSYNFENLVDVLNYIFQRSSIETNQDLLKVCEDYFQTGSKASIYQLEDHGFPIKKQSDSH